MKKKIVSILVLTLFIAMVLPVMGMENESDKITFSSDRQEYDYGDAPEGDNAIAYPSLGILGSFPTCKGSGPSGFVQHDNYGGYLGPGVDFENEGNGGTCPGGFPPYDQDECYKDGDAGLIIPEPFTIDSAYNEIPCPGGNGTSLGKVGQTAAWGTDIDIHVHNTMPNHPPYVIGYLNLIIDWNQNGMWGDPGEHVLINHIVPALYIGPASGLSPPSFTIGPNSGYVWVRFSITEAPVPQDWNGEGNFEDGESEDYLFHIKKPKPDLDCKGSISWAMNGGAQPGGTKTATFQVGNIGESGSLLNWQITSWPSWGTWSFSPSSGTNLPAGSWTTVTATCVPPNQPNQMFTGEIEICNTDDPSDCCKIPVLLKTSRNKAVYNYPLFQWFLEKYPNIFPILRAFLGI
jgi:hypothetical protein